MFFSKYLNEFYFSELIETYDKEYLRTFDENNFNKIYNLFKDLGFYFIDDVILKYLEIFELDYGEVKEKILKLKNELGKDYVSKIGKNLSYLNEIIDE